MAAPSDQCAVAADGSLLDASEILFYNDPDDNTPLPNSNSAATSTHLHPFFQGSPAPRKIVAGSRRSARVTHPSARITDPNNLEASVTRKRSATVMTSAEGSLRTAHRAKLTGGDDENEHDEESDNAEVDTGDDDDAGNVYPNSTKLLNTQPFLGWLGTTWLFRGQQHLLNVPSQVVGSQGPPIATVFQLPLLKCCNF
jgi:hypothetical protein